MEKFIVLSYPRTGSTFLVKKINTIEDIVCHSEIFHNHFDAFSRAFLDRQIINRHLNKPVFGFLLNEKRVLKKLFKLKNSQPQRFLEEIYQCKATAIGFKLFPGQNDVQFSKLLDKKDVHKIVLERKNRLRSYISEQISIKTNKWDLYHGEKPVKVQVTVDPNDFFRYKKKIDEYVGRIENHLKLTNQCYLKLTYDQILDSFPNDKLFELLAIPDKPVQTNDVNQKKQNPYSLNELIKNYDGVKVELQKKGFEHFLE